MAHMLRARCTPVTMLLLALLTGEAAARPPAAVDWHAIIRPFDRERIRNWRTSWKAALANARANGAATRVMAEGVLLDPDASFESPDLPDGDYLCRALRIGAIRPGESAFSEAPPVRCRAGGGRFAVLEGPQRPEGRMWKLDPLRMLFLGSVALGDETRALDYGRDPDRNAAGVIQHIGPDRWRLVLPRPQWQSLLEVIDIVPAVSPTPR